MYTYGIATSNPELDLHLKNKRAYLIDHYSKYLNVTIIMRA